MEGFISVAKQKPQHFDKKGVRSCVWAAWSTNNQMLLVFADTVGTDSCTADYWKPVEENLNMPDEDDGWIYCPNCGRVQEG